MGVISRLGRIASVAFAVMGGSFLVVGVPSGVLGDWPVALISTLGAIGCVAVLIAVLMWRGADGRV